jgi:hypothetical protein
MSGMSLAMAACIAGERDWRRCTLGTLGSTVGFAGAPTTPQGSMAAALTAFRGANIFICYATNSGGAGAFRLSFSTAGLGASFINALEVVRSDGTSVIFKPTDSNFIYATGAGFSEYDWNPTPNNYVWTAADAGKTLGIHLS